MCLENERDHSHRSETTVLPTNPRLGTGVVIIPSIKAELVLSIILSRKIAQNSIAFKDRQTAVIMVNKHGDAAIGVECGEPRFLLHTLTNVNGLMDVVDAVGGTDLFKCDGGLDAVGGGPC